MIIGLENFSSTSWCRVIPVVLSDQMPHKVSTTRLNIPNQILIAGRIKRSLHQQEISFVIVLRIHNESENCRFVDLFRLQKQRYFLGKLNALVLFQCARHFFEQSCCVLTAHQKLFFFSIECFVFTLNRRMRFFFWGSRPLARFSAILWSPICPGSFSAMPRAGAPLERQGAGK